MGREARAIAVVVCVLAIAMLAGQASTTLRPLASAQARVAQQPFVVTSTLDGKKSLPTRLHWLVQPKLSSTHVTQVDFLIDGKVRWIEHDAPYNYASDDNGGNRGFLITTWLSAGVHTFTSRVRDDRSRVATDTVRARVGAAPEPPAALRGKIWSRRLSSSPDGPPAGRWELVYDRVGAWHLDPLGSGVVNQYSVRGNVIYVFAPIEMAPLINDHTSIRKYGHHDIGGSDCTFAGPFGSYHWSVVGTRLTLKAIKEGCPGRKNIWEGTWDLGR
jgi:hypothetical protein